MADARLKRRTSKVVPLVRRRSRRHWLRRRHPENGLSARAESRFRPGPGAPQAGRHRAPGEDRFPYVPDLTGPDHMQVIASALTKRGQPASVVEKVLGANFQRVIGEIWGQVRACSSRHHILRETIFCELRGASACESLWCVWLFATRTREGAERSRLIGWQDSSPVGTISS